MNTAKQRSVAGISLLAVLFTMGTVAALTAVVFSVTNTQVTVTRRTASRAAAVTYADGVMESLFDQWRNAMISVTNATDRTDGLSTAGLSTLLAAPSAAVLPQPQGVTLANWSVTAATPLLGPTTDSTGRPVPENGTTSRLRVRLYYLATVSVTFAGPTSGNNTVTLQRTFIRAGRNLFDNFYFGTQQKTEFHPGPDMYVSGTAYIGGDLYTAHDSLHFTKDVTFTGTHHLGYRPEDSRFGSPSQAAITTGGLGNNWDLNNPPRYGSQQKLFDTPTSALDPNFLDDPISNDVDSDGNANNDGYREIIEEKSGTGADPLQLDSSTSERLVNNADYRIYVTSTNAVSIFKGASTTPLATTNAEYVAIQGALTTNTAMRDVREGDNVRMVTLNVSAIKSAFDTGKIHDQVGGGDGLLFYVKDRSAGTSVGTKVVNSATGTSSNVTSTRSRGVKLINGAALPSVGLSVVSPNPVYIQGDYNTGTTSTSKPPSNTTSTYVPPVNNPSPNVPGYNRIPAAVVGDAVNILSNNWNDANSLLSLSNRTASNTTVNAAIVAGSVPTTTSSYSGGIENFTRFHEGWGGKYLTIYGAIALLYNSAEAKRPWSNADYGAPNRRWYYDSMLQDNNPPGFRVARTYERGGWARR